MKLHRSRNLVVAPSRLLIGSSRVRLESLSRLNSSHARRPSPARNPVRRRCARGRRPRACLHTQRDLPRIVVARWRSPPKNRSTGGGGRAQSGGGGEGGSGDEGGERQRRRSSNRKARLKKRQPKSNLDSQRPDARLHSTAVATFDSSKRATIKQSTTIGKSAISRLIASRVRRSVRDGRRDVEPTIRLVSSSPSEAKAASDDESTRGESSKSCASADAARLDESSCSRSIALSALFARALFAVVLLIGSFCRLCSAMLVDVRKLSSSIVECVGATRRAESCFDDIAVTCAS